MEKGDICMRIKEMFELQYKLQERLGTWGKIKTEADRQQFVNQMILAMQEEVVEIMRETCYKNPDYVPFGWKKNQSINKENLISEVVDLFHFMMNVCLAYGFTAEEFYSAYCSKNNINHERQEKGY